MDEILFAWKAGQVFLFLWSLLCFFLGVAFAGVLYHYYISTVIKKANKALERLNPDFYP
jgi:uncharacterized membrane protein YoaK (UPF0700 family)